jgi:hypothetical protein
MDTRKTSAERHSAAVWSEFDFGIGDPDWRGPEQMHAQQGAPVQATLCGSPQRISTGG